MSQLSFIKRENIDEQKWNACVQHSTNSLPYCFSWYLDAVAENWDALIWNDYEFIMPLVWLRKFGVACLYQPNYCQQLGVFGKQPTEKNWKPFLEEARKLYPYVQCNLNASAKVVVEQFQLQSKKNLLLDLNFNYEMLRKNFSENTRRNISKAEKSKLTFGEVEVKLFQSFYLQNINREKETFKPQHEKIFKQLTDVVNERKAGQIFSVSDGEGKMLAASLLLFHQNRIINIINTSSAEGKKAGASHFLFAQIIRQYSDKNLVLDFEGSSIEGVARFYESFGAKEETFYMLRTNLVERIFQKIG